MKIKCEHPVLIFNPNIVWLLSVKCHRASLGNYKTLVYYPGGSSVSRFPWRDLYVAREQVTPDTLDDYYLFDDDGVTYPVFMYVPCGKCRLCKQHSIEEWETRCMCESACADYPPLFITLTFAPEHRPVVDVPDWKLEYDLKMSADEYVMEETKRKFQLFMKRLRNYVERRTGVDGELRYVAVSEFTPSRHYPHIHMLLWNMPFISPREGDLNSFQALCSFIQNDCWQYGYCRVERCRDTSGRYCFKYLSKTDDSSCWRLSSRRHGIGYKYALQYLPAFLKNPDLTTLSVVDGDNKVRTRAIPSYFKRIWFPTLSVLFPNDVTKAVKDFVALAPIFRFAVMQLYGPTHRLLTSLYLMFGDLMDKYDIMHVDWDDASVPPSFATDTYHYIGIKSSFNQICSYDVRKRINTADIVVCPDGEVDIQCGSLIVPGTDSVAFKRSDANLNSSFCVEYRKYLIEIWKRIRECYYKLYKFDFDKQYYIDRLNTTQTHQELVRLAMLDVEDPDINTLVDKYEIDQRWIRVNWMRNENV